MSARGQTGEPGLLILFATANAGQSFSWMVYAGTGADCEVNDMLKGRILLICIGGLMAACLAPFTGIGSGMSPISVGWAALLPPSHWPPMSS